MRAASVFGLIALAAACGAQIDSEGSGGASSTTGSTGQAGGAEFSGKYFCNPSYGTLRHYDKKCPKGEVCTNVDCCSLDDPTCATPDHPSNSNDLYCGTDFGWQRMPIMAPGGHVCAPDQVCAQHGAKDCSFICCRIPEDPTCGTFYSDTATECGFF